MFCKPLSRAGAFCLCYGPDPRARKTAQEPLVLVLTRPDSSKRIVACNPGGHLDPSNENEEPLLAALRELKEELVDPDGNPVLKNIKPKRLLFIASGLGATAGTDKTTYWFAYACPLFPYEMEILQAYERNMSLNPAYARGVLKASRGEVGGAKLVPVGELLAKIKSGEIVYGCRHGQEPVLSFLQTLHEQTPERIQGKRLIRPFVLTRT